MKRVLIVDDTAFMRMTLKTMLERNGYEVVGEAENGEVALEKYKELSPDLVTMDITMPKVDGIEATKAIKDFDKNARIVMISALGQEGKVAEAIVAGALNFIVKPFKEDFVINALNKISSGN